MKNKIAWFTLGFAVLLCVAATTPIDRLRLTSDADGGNHAVTNVNTFSVTTVSAVNLSLSGPILGTVQTNTGAINALEFVGSGAKLTGITGGNANALTNNDTRQIVFAGTASNSVSIVSTSGVAFFRSNPTNSSITIGTGDLQPAGVPAGATFIGGVTVITNLAQTISTNFISGFAYLNPGPRSIFVSYEGNAAVAVSAGDNAGASLSIDPTGGFTFTTSVSHGGETTTATSIARTVHFTLFGVINPGQSYVFTNQCTGANTMNFISGTGRLTQF